MLTLNFDFQNIKIANRTKYRGAKFSLDGTSSTHLMTRRRNGKTKAKLGETRSDERGSRGETNLQLTPVVPQHKFRSRHHEDY